VNEKDQKLDKVEEAVRKLEIRVNRIERLIEAEAKVIKRGGPTR
jgi:hypothetical protein